MSRVQLALNVGDLESSIDFYTKLFGTEPHKIEPGYANFAIAEPPLKLVLFEGGGEPGSLNHLGVEVETTEEVADTDARLRGEGVDTITQDATTCCHAVLDKTWATDPSGRAWRSTRSSTTSRPPMPSTSRHPSAPRRAAAPRP